LELARAALQSGEATQVIRQFCQRARDLLGASAAYYWKRVSEQELVGGEVGDGGGKQSHDIVPCDQMPSFAWEAVESRRTVAVHPAEVSRYPFLVEAGASGAVAAPLQIAGEVSGAIAFLHTPSGAPFHPSEIDKVAIFAAQLGSALEALRLSQLSREEHRRASILAEVATALPGFPDTTAVTEGIADRLRELLHCPAVMIFVQKQKLLQLQAVSTEAPRLAERIRVREGENDLRSAHEIASRAVSAGEPITVNIDGGSHLGEGAPSGGLIAAPFRTSRSYGVILVYPRFSGPFTQEDKSLISALAGFGAVAVANAELYGMARAQARELNEILEISGELSSAGRLDEFMQKSVVRAASFLGFERCFIGLLEDATFHIRWGFENGIARPFDIPLNEGTVTRNLKQKDVFYTEDAAQIPEVNREFLTAYKVKGFLAVPLLGSNGEVLGTFGVLDRIEPGPIDDEDVRRARALAAQIAIALELTNNLHKAEQHRQRAEALVTLALDLNPVLNLPDFMRRFAMRAAALLGGKAVAISLFDIPDRETLVMRGAAECEDKALIRRLTEGLRSALPKHTEDVCFAAAGDLLGSPLAESLGWTDCTLVRLAGTSGELAGLLCLADRGAPPGENDRQLMRAAASQASIALENARLFTRMEQANRHWMDVFDAISDYIVVHDQDNNILRVNRSLADFIGLEPDQLIGINMRALEMLTASSAPHCCPLCRSGEGINLYIQADMERSFLVSTSRVHGATAPESAARELGEKGGSEAPSQTVHVLKDITDRREAEKRYRELFDNIQEGIYVSTPQGRFVEVNDAMVRILGYDSREELLGIDIPTQLYFSPERRRELAEQLKQSGEMHNQEEVLRRKDGTPVNVYMNCYAMRDVNGAVVQHRGLMLDITGLRESQTELQKERDFSSKILNHTQSVILVTDPEGVISYANRRWSGLGFQQNHILGHSFLEFCGGGRREELRHALAAVARGQQVDNFDLPLLRVDGASAQFSANLSPISGGDGRVNSIVVVMTDVTDSAVLRAKLLHAEKMAAVGHLVSGVAHEVNNPLTAILGFTDLLMENPELPESARRDLRVILQEAQRTKQIVQNLLSFARQMPPRRQPIQLNSILKRTVQLRSYDFVSHGIQVVEQLDEALPEIVGDSHQLQQVFLNILNNAYDAVRECGRPARIEIVSARTETGIEISFRDNGIGIVDADRIFDPFFTTKDVGKGTGLGLSICYGIIREHGGEIMCHNNLDSEGATFIVRLPLAADGASFGAAAGVFQK
jgi:two-component system NtrC family sensor kinase